MPASSSIADIAYDEDRRILSVWFVSSGKRYDYADVPPDTYEAFCAAESLGGFHNRYIRDRFDYVEIG